MKDRILTEPDFGLGVIVWIIAVTYLPFSLGMNGGSFMGFAAYLLVAGMLLAVADALFNSATYHSLGDVLLQGVFWMIALSVPAMAAFLIGTTMVPSTVKFEDNLCRMAGLSHVEAHPEGAMEEALEPTEDCETAS